MADAPTDQILTGIAICAAKTYEWTLDKILSGEWPGIFSHWRKQLRGPWYHRIKPDLEDAEALFRAYLEDGYSDPPIYRSAGGSNSISISAPWELVLKYELVRSGFSESEVLNGYLRARRYEFYAIRELRAAESCTDPKRWRKVFYTQADAQQMAALRELESQEENKSE